MKHLKWHIFIWSLLLLLQFLIFKYLLHTSSVVSHVLIFVSNQIVAFYLNYNLLIPRYYQKNKYLNYILSVLVVIATSSFVVTLVEHLFPHADHSQKAVDYFNIEPFLAHALPSIMAIFFSFFIYSYQLKRQQEKKEIYNLKAEKNFLIQQINPHFLFNALNNIYSLTIDQNPKGSEAILKLSSMLDYSLYKASNTSNSLKQEIQYINNYLELFKLKDDDISNIHFNYENCDDHYSIAPLLLLPFIENALKHGNIEDSIHGKLDIRISTQEQTVLFTCTNTYSTAKSVDHTGGIGIANVSRRLELIYPNKHELQITKDRNLYCVSLKIKL